MISLNDSVTFTLNVKPVQLASIRNLLMLLRCPIKVLVSTRSNLTNS
jgi:hypothetical protein